MISRCTSLNVFSVVFMSLILFASICVGAETKKETLVSGKCELDFEFPCTQTEPFFLHSREVITFSLNWRRWRSSFSLTQDELLCYQSINAGNTTRNVLFQFDNFQSRFKIHSSGVIEKNGSSYGVTIDDSNNIPNVASPDKIVYIEFNFRLELKSAERILRKFPNARLFSFSFLPDTQALKHILSEGVPESFFWAFLHEPLPSRLRREASGIMIPTDKELGNFFKELLPLFLVQKSLKWLEIALGIDCDSSILKGSSSSLIGLIIIGEVSPEAIELIDRSFKSLSILHLPDCKSLEMIPLANFLRHFSGCLSKKYDSSISSFRHLVSLQTNQDSAMSLGRIETLRYLHIVGNLSTSDSFDLSEFPVIRFLSVGGSAYLHKHPNPVPLSLDTIVCKRSLSCGKVLTVYIENNLSVLDVVFLSGYRASRDRSGFKASNIRVLVIGGVSGTRTPVPLPEAIIDLQPIVGYSEVCIAHHRLLKPEFETAMKIKTRSLYLSSNPSFFNVPSWVHIIDDSELSISNSNYLSLSVNLELQYRWYRYLGAYRKID